MNKIGMNGALIRASDEVNRYLERMPGFLTADAFEHVTVFKTLRTKDQETVLQHLRKRSSVSIFIAKRSRNGREVELFRHIKHGSIDSVTSIPGYIYPLEAAPAAAPKKQRAEPIVDSKPLPQVAPVPKQMCETCGHEKSFTEFAPIPGGGYCKTCERCLDKFRHEAEIAKEKSGMSINKSGLAGMTPEQMRKMAAELQQQADEAEKSTASRDAINKQLEPVRRQALQTGAALTRKFEEMLDAMGAHEKAMAALRDFKVVL